MDSNISIINTINWLDASQRMLHHAGTWDFEYLENKNRITRVYSHACTMAYLDGATLKVIIISAGATPTGGARLIGCSMLQNNMMHLLIDVEDVVLNITTHVPGLTEEGLSSISQLMLIELVVPDISAMHKNFAIWAMQYLPMEYVKSEDDLNLQLQLLLSLHESSYVAGLVSSTSDIEAILHGGKNPLPTVDDSIIRQIDFTLL